jgi:hypothetical protein
MQIIDGQHLMNIFLSRSFQFLDSASHVACIGQTITEAIAEAPPQHGSGAPHGLSIPVG